MTAMSGRVTFGAFELDLESGRLRKSGRVLKLRPQPARVLCLLVSQAAKLVDREEIRRLLWGDSTFVDYDVGVDYCVYRIRSALGDSAQAPRYVETLPGRGYRFIAPVTRERSFAEPTIAVLPFANLNRDPARDYFADGITDALITELARIPAVRVISRQSVLHLKDSSRTLKEIVRGLNVDGVVEGGCSSRSASTRGRRRKPGGPSDCSRIPFSPTSSSGGPPGIRAGRRTRLPPWKRLSAIRAKRCQSRTWAMSMAGLAGQTRPGSFSENSSNSVRRGRLRRPRSRSSTRGLARSTRRSTGSKRRTGSGTGPCSGSPGLPGSIPFTQTHASPISSVAWALLRFTPRLAAAVPDAARRMCQPRSGCWAGRFAKFLTEYPNATLADSTDFLYWQETQFGLKPTVRISRLVIQDGPEQTVVASKMLYASHYFWTALELRVLLPDPARGPGFWLVTVNRSRSDGLSGFTGRVIRGRVRSEIEDGTRAALAATKTRLESQGTL